MVSACPTEGDPRIVVEAFVRDESLRTIAGLRDEGLEKLMDVVHEEVIRQSPDANMIILDHALASEFCFPRELTAYLESVFKLGGYNVVLIPTPLSMVGWQHAFSPLVEKGYKVQVYFTSIACHQVPICSKLF